MMTPARIIRLIGITGLVAWLGMVGWAAKTTRAQNGAQANPPTSASAEQPKDGPPPPIAADSLAAPTPTLKMPDHLSSPPTAHGEPVLPGISPAADANIAPPQAPATEEPPVAASEDPEKSAQSFVERSRKEAETQLKVLTGEAEHLRARLARLETGIKKWQSLVNALRTAQGLETADHPTVLEPIPARSEGGKSDKRVRWASSAPTPAQPGEPAQTAPGAEPGGQGVPPRAALASPGQGAAAAPQPR
jgi:hypothetical protein